MKKIYMTLLGCAVVGITLLTSNASGPASNGNRATGAPGDGSNTCVSCHNGNGNFGNVSIDLSMTDENGNEKSEYVPDSVYEIKVTVNNSMGSPAGYGFQMICLDSDDDNYDGWDNPSSNAQLSTSASRDYVEHDGISSSNEFTVDWTAPSEGSGEITFYVGANAVNGTGGTDMDRAAIDDFSFDEKEEEGDPNSIEEVEKKQLLVYPNPTSGVVNIQTNNSVKIINHLGQVVGLHNVTNNQMDISQYPTGFYLLRDTETGASNKIFKL